MGCDGGTIPKRDELVRLKKKPEQKDKISELSFRWQHCNVSQEPLKKPIVACQLGRLYNKDVIIEKLLDKTSIPETMSHIKGLKDIKDLNLTFNTAFKDEPEKGGNKQDRQAAPHICPISGLEMNGKFKFCFFWTCGCVLSERALKQFTEKGCPLCQKPFTDNDIVIMNAVDEDLQRNVKRREERHNVIKANKKEKNKVKKQPEDEDPQVKAEKSNEDNVKTEIISKISTATYNKAVKREKVEPSSSKTDSKRPLEELYDPAFKKLKQSYSVSNDPNATDVYKSLFTTSSAAKTHEKAHWVTFNPFYN